MTTPSNYVVKGIDPIVAQAFSQFISEMWNKVAVYMKRSVIAPKMSFNRSFRPIFFCINLIGIPLGNLSFKSANNLSKMALIMHSLICYTLNVGSTFVHYFFSAGFGGSNLTTYLWNSEVIAVNHSMETLGVHTGLLFTLAYTNWNPLCQLIRCMEKEKNFARNQDFVKFHRVCLLGSFFVVLVRNFNIRNKLWNDFLKRIYLGNFLSSRN